MNKKKESTWLELAYYYFGLGPLLSIILIFVRMKLGLSFYFEWAPKTYLPILKVIILWVIIPIFFWKEQKGIEKIIENLKNKFRVWKFILWISTIVIIMIYVNFLILSLVDATKGN